MNEAAHTISLITPSKLSSSFNMSNSDPTSFILNERETRFEWNRRFHGCGRHFGSGANATKFTVNVWEKS